MKFKVLVALFIGLFFLIFSFGLAQGAQEDAQGVETTENIPEPARISYVEGVVKLNTENAEVNLPVIAADEVITEDGRIEIALGKGDYIRLDKNTRLRFVEFTKDSTKIFIETGNVYVRAYSQVVDVEGKKFTYPVRNDFIRVGIDEQGGSTKFRPQTPADEFDKWNEQREEELISAEETEDTRYLPEELNEYEKTLSQYGEWRDHDRYGYVWIPNVSYGWQPYYYGRWIHIPILGWFWASYESFGWCTYHYGRWQWDPFWGSWYWIPTTIWGPAWVNWYGWGNYYGWCPRWHDRWYYDRYYDSYYRYGYGRAWTFVRKDQLKNRNIHTVAARRSELQSKAQISSNQLLRKPVAPALNQISRSSSRQISRGTISQIQLTSSRPQAQISRKGIPAQVQNKEARIQSYPSRLTNRSSVSPERKISPKRDFSRFDSPRISSSPTRESYSPSHAFRFSPESRSLSPRSSRQSFSPSSSLSRFSSSVSARSSSSFRPASSLRPSASSRPSVSSRPSASSSRGPSGPIRKK